MGPYVCVFRRAVAPSTISFRSSVWNLDMARLFPGELCITQSLAVVVSLCGSGCVGIDQTLDDVD